MPKKLNTLLPIRFFPFGLCILVSILSFLTIDLHERMWIAFAVSSILTVIGVFDCLQSSKSILRNYPVIGHLRFLLEFIRPEIRQYFIEGENDETPFSRSQRTLVYSRAKAVSDKRPFGTTLDVMAAGYQWINQSLAPTHLKTHDFRIEVGGKDCLQKYSASIFNISALSFGSLSANAIMALNLGAKKGGFAHDTGEGSISRHHRVHGGDLIWEIGSGYFGCRKPDGHFDIEKFTQVANDPQIKMIEIKLSQGAKPGHGGILPAAKVTPEIALTRDVPMGVDCVSPSRHTAFNTPVEMLEFFSLLREKSGGKPVGFKLCIGKPEDWFAILKAMIDTQLTPDFIVVDGSEGGTGAAPVEFIDHIGMPMRDSLRLIHQTLIGANLRSRIKLGAAGKIISAFDIVRACAIGADWCNSARGFMFAIGCIQSRTCNTDMCPTGVATQNTLRQKALDPVDKGTRVYQFHKNTMHALKEILAAAAIHHPSELKPNHIMRRDENGVTQPFSKHLLHIEAGALLQSDPSQAFTGEYAYLRAAWNTANANNW